MTVGETRIMEEYTLVPQNDTNYEKKMNNHNNNTDVEKPILKGEYDPFEERDTHNPTTDWQTLTHLLKSTIGTGIMAMPYAFQASGIIGGVIGGLILGAICTNASYILVKSSHKLYVKARKPKMDYEDVVETAFATGPKWCRKYSKHIRKFVIIWLFSAYFGACVTDNLLIATNYGQVYRYYSTKLYNGSENFNATEAALEAMEPVQKSLLRAIMACCLIPIIIFVWVPDLKYLAPISTLANFLMATVLGITCYYLVQDPKPMEDLSLFRSIKELPRFFGITIFSMQNVGVLMPLENNMKTPRHFVGTCGVLNKSMFVVTTVYIVFGALGYIKYGDDVSVIVTTNLPIGDVTGQIVKFLIATTVLLTFSLQFYVCRSMVWEKVKKHFPKKPILAEYTIRTCLVIACVSIAIALPEIRPLVTLVGSLGYSFLGIICPTIVEMVTYWDIGYGRFNWKIYKNAIVLLFGLFALVFGTIDAIHDIVKEYAKR